MKLGLFWPLINRFEVIDFHLISTLLLLLIVYNHHKVPPQINDSLDDKLFVTFLLAFIIPIFGLYGILILPDSGLILGLSLMLYASDNILRQNFVSFKNSIILGLGLGIGLLSKYHILPLGGGMILGLYLDLGFRNKPISNLYKLFISTIIGLVIGLPLFIWNYNNNYASFIFQLQHGFSSNNWQYSSMLKFILGALLYLTPWFAYALIKNGFKKRYYYLLIPVICLFIILIISSLRKDILPHWIAPAFWLLIPYTVINTKNLQSLKTMCKYTSILWLILLFILILPGGMLNIKYITKLFNPDTTGLADLLLWQELPQLFGDNNSLQNSLTNLKQTKIKNCNYSEPLIGTTRWYWTAQLEYHRVFGEQFKFLNLDMQSSNFYNWRDNWAKFANCPILVISDSKSLNLNDVQQLININNRYTINGLGDYKSLNLTIIEGTLTDEVTLNRLQNKRLSNSHY